MLNSPMSFFFRMEIDGITIAYASEVSGLTKETEIEPFEECGINYRVDQFPKRTKYQHITLKRGITNRDELWQWHQEVIEGRVTGETGLSSLWVPMDTTNGGGILSRPIP